MTPHSIIALDCSRCLTQRPPSRRHPYAPLLPREADTERARREPSQQSLTAALTRSTPCTAPFPRILPRAPRIHPRSLFNIHLFLFRLGQTILLRAPLPFRRLSTLTLGTRCLPCRSSQPRSAASPTAFFSNAPALSRQFAALLVPTQRSTATSWLSCWQRPPVFTASPAPPSTPT